MAVTPGTYNMTIQRRSDHSVQLIFKDNSDSAINLTGFTVAAQVWEQTRKTKYADFAIAYTDRAAGKIDISLTDTQTETFKPDTVLKHGDIISTDEYTLETIHTPGHASNHLCFYIEKYKCLLTGDHIMDGSTVVIAPPDGNMTEYINSLKLLEQYDISYFAPGHGNYM